METLLDLLPRIEALGDREAVRFSNGVRTWIRSYSDLYGEISRFAGYLDDAGFRKGDRLLLWSENRSEWIAVFWACLARGVEVVPVDAHSSPNRVARIQDEARIKLLVFGNTTSVDSLPGDVFALEELLDLPLSSDFVGGCASGDDVVEILYTSGTTAEPKGVVHRHRNICANLTPIGNEIDRYRKWARPFQPIRFLDLLPLSHMFGQSMGIFIPILLGGSVVFTTDLHPTALRRTIHSERVSVLVCVPRILGTLRADVERRHPKTASEKTLEGGVFRRWWRHRAVHRELGWKFWAFVVGGAELDETMEEFWSRIGLLVVQGYGLTETSPVVAVNHPFHARRGTLGRSVGGHELRIGDDGEILVRGASVVEEYVESGSGRRSTTDSDGWFHTGDIGEIDADGRLIYRGRKKDVFVTPDGLNVYPEDVERVLNDIPGIRESAVVPNRGERGERPHAVLILETQDDDPSRLIEKANHDLEPEQRIQSWSLWSGDDFPRTPSTLKVQRRLVAAHVEKTGTDSTSRVGNTESFIDILRGLTGRRSAELSEEKSLAEDLGLSSLERVDLLAGLEARYGIELDEAMFSEALTVRELTAQVRAARGTRRAGPQTSPTRTGRQPDPGRRPPPRWSRHILTRLFRATIQTVLVRPLFRCFVTTRIEGVEKLENISPPVLFASTHASHFDAPAILAALPNRWRRRLAPAVRQEYFFPLDPSDAMRTSWLLRLEYYLSCAAFNVYPFPQQLGQVRDSLRYTGELVGAGYCPLIFPEGRRTPDGEIQPFQAGIGFMAVWLRIWVVPLRLEGTFDVFPTGARWPRRGTVRVKIGNPLRPTPDESYREFAARLENAVRSMG